MLDQWHHLTEMIEALLCVSPRISAGILETCLMVFFSDKNTNASVIFQKNGKTPEILVYSSD